MDLMNLGIELVLVIDLVCLLGFFVFEDWFFVVDYGEGNFFDIEEFWVI